MMHFFKRLKIHLDCFTSRREVIEYAPIVPATDLFPEWWLKLPKDSKSFFYPAPTMKTCAGLQDYYTKSIAIPLWSELCIDVKPNSNVSWQFADGLSKADVHLREQYSGFVDESHYMHLKLLSPWLFKTKVDVSWLFTAPAYNLSSFTDYIVPQGVLNFNKQVVTNIQLMLNIFTPKTILLPYRMPFLLTPLTDKKVVIHRHLVSKEVFESMNEDATPTCFINKYREQQKINKCPYKDNIK
jgi:hypothetical protein